MRLIERWWRTPRLHEAIAERVNEALARRGVAPSDVHVVFTAHSLPARVREAGDPYESEVRKHAALLAGRLGLPRWSFAFQSAGATREPWLGPSLIEKLRRIAAAGGRRVLVAPIGFVCDHMEVLYDLDIEARERAADLGLELWRTESLNVNPTFIAALADVVESAESSD